MSIASSHKRRDLLGRIGIGLGIAGQLQWGSSKERHSLEKASLSNIEHRVAILFQEEGKVWSTLTKKIRVKKWIEPKGQIFPEAYLPNTRANS